MEPLGYGSGSGSKPETSSIGKGKLWEEDQNQIVVNNPPPKS